MKYLIQANYTYSKVTRNAAIGTIGANNVSIGDGLNPKNGHGTLKSIAANFAYSACAPRNRLGEPAPLRRGYTDRSLFKRFKFTERCSFVAKFYSR